MRQRSIRCARRCARSPSRRPARSGSTSARARAARARRRDRPGRGDRHLRLRPPHLPRPGADRAGLRDRPRVRRHGGRRRRRRHRGRGRRPRARLPTAPPAATCFFCRRGEFHKCDEARVFGHGATLGSLQGAQAEQVLVPHANLTLRRVPDGLSDDVALFAGDVMGTGYHAIDRGRGVSPGDTRRGARPRARSGCAPCRRRKAAGAGAGDRDRHGRGAPADGRVASARRRST